MSNFHLTVNGQTLTFSEGQMPEVQSALQEAAKNPGDQAVRASQFGEIRARMDGLESNSAMNDSNVQLTDC